MEYIRKSTLRNLGTSSLVIGLAATCSALMFSHGAYAATINVPGDHPTVQAAIDAAMSGDTVVVAAGTFTENLVIDVPITLQGAQAGVDGCAARGAGESIIDSTGSQLELKSGSAGAVIDGFTFSGGGNAILSSGGPIDNVQIRNNRILAFTGSGIFLNDSGNDITVHQNLVDGASSAGGGIVHLDQDNFDGFHLTDNCIVNAGNGTGFFVDGTRNIGVSGARSPAIVGNLFDSNAVGANIGRLAIEFASISQNTFSNNAYDGLQGGPADSTISENSFTSNGRSGLALTGFGGGGDPARGAQDNSIIQNCFTDNVSEGIFFSSSQSAGTISTNIVNGNNITGNTTGVFYGGTETIDATGNWWGDASGPGGDGPGSGDTVDGMSGAGSIDFSGFLAVFAENTPCTPASPTFTGVGFEAPMDNGPVSVKKNRVLPLKCLILDDQGSPVTDIVAAPVLQVVFTPVVGPAVDVTGDALTAGKGSEGNEFELAGSNWQFNLKTKNFTASGTYEVSAVSGDANEYIIDPGCHGSFVIN
ncbi:right-handed parallel beta-helix repeat-containing protein [Elongatibacter sediminis]|uniref:Right-handed parallel beta-helix repeat-containing protein n=1 Tax=Elongatibacter sediminis TaxID=3119006 RepID=A0AAW9RNM3_9GAMM